MNLSRRSLIGGILALGIAPAIVRVGSIMPVKVSGGIDPDAWAWNGPEFVPGGHINNWGHLPPITTKTWARRLNLEVINDAYLARLNVLMEGAR